MRGGMLNHRLWSFSELGLTAKTGAYWCGEEVSVNSTVVQKRRAKTQSPYVAEES